MKKYTVIRFLAWVTILLTLASTCFFEITDLWLVIVSALFVNVFSLTIITISSFFFSKNRRSIKPSGERSSDEIASIGAFAIIFIVFIGSVFWFSRPGTGINNLNLEHALLFLMIPSLLIIFILAFSYVTEWKMNKFKHGDNKKVRVVTGALDMRIITNEEVEEGVDEFIK